MSSITTSMLVHFGYDLQADSTRIQVTRTETAEPLRLGNNSFLLRISVDEDTLVVRCCIRHIASGREAYVQGGQSLYTFVTSCLSNESTRDESAEQ